MSRRRNETVGGDNNRLLIVVGGAKVGDTPNSLFKNFLPIVTFVDFTTDADFFDDKAVLFGEGGVEDRRRN